MEQVKHALVAAAAAAATQIKIAQAAEITTMNVAAKALATTIIETQSAEIADLQGLPRSIGWSSRAS